MIKFCIKCGIEKESSEFYKHKTHKDGFRNDCKKCNNERGKSWMNWENYGCELGCWNIDHIKPDSLFNYSSVNDKEFQQCWALSNLQPLEWMENIMKSNKYS